MDADVLKEQLWTSLGHSPFIMVGLTGKGLSEPLTAQLDKDQVDRLYFFIGRDNRLASGGAATAHYMAKGHDLFACLTGTVSIDPDRAMVDKLWNNQVAAWFPGGKDDPSLALLRFDIDDTELWASDMSLTGKVKMLFGVTVDADEVGSHARVGTTAA